jgi:predicted  nucleic acid-binding Zn-ribbon protein
MDLILTWAGPSPQTALQTKHRELEEVQERHTTKEQRIGDLQHQLEGESRALAAARNDLHTASGAHWTSLTS